MPSAPAINHFSLLMPNKIIKYSLALIFLIAGAVGYHEFPDVLPILRALMVLVGILLAAAVLWTTEVGKRFLSFFKEALDELKKVVWPSRKETLQSTLMVFVFVVVMALFLWLTDKALEWFLYEVIMGWRR